MKQIEKLQAKARQRFGFCGSLIIHFILFVVLAFSGVFAMQPPAADADTVVFFDAGGGGGGGSDEAVADAADDGEEQVEEVVEEETITLPDGKIEHKQVVKHVVKHVPAGAKKGSGGGSGNASVAVMPRIIRKIDPVYPAAERNAGITGSGVVRLLVNTNGTVDEVTLVSSSGNANLDQAGINAAYKWRFTSAVGTNGQKVRCYLRLPFTFRLR
jgi:protein TonB